MPRTNNENLIFGTEAERISVILDSEQMMKDTTSGAVFVGDGSTLGGRSLDVRPYIELTTAHSLTRSDEGKVLQFNSSSAFAVTIPLNATHAFPVDLTRIPFLNIGAGEVTFTTEVGVTVDSPSAVVQVGEGGYLVKTGTNTWFMSKGNVQDAVSLNGLSDVVITSVSNGQVLTYNSASGKWKNQANSDITYDLSIPVDTTKIRLAGSDGSSDDITLTGAGGTTVTRTSGTEITIAGLNDNTTYSLGSSMSGANGVIDLTPSVGSATTVTLGAGNNITITEAGSTITLNSVKYTDAEAVQALEQEGVVALTGALTVAGNFTVDTTTFKVDSINNRVGILNSSPATALDVGGTIRQDGATTGLVYADSNGDLLGGRTITAGTGMTVTNGNAVAGNPVINTTISQYTNALAVSAVEAESTLDLTGVVSIAQGLTVDTNTLVVASATNRVGIAQSSPAYPLDITGDLNLTGALRISGTPLDFSNLTSYNASPSDGQVLKWNAATSKWIAGSDVNTNTTYDLSIPTSTTKIRLAGSDGSNDDITVTGGTNVTVTRVSATELSLSSTAGFVKYTDAEAVSAVEASDLTFTGTVDLADGLTVGTGTPKDMTVDVTNSRTGINVDAPTEALDVLGNFKLSGNAVVGGNLTVNGTTTTVNTATLSVKDPIIFVGNDNTANLVDLGYVGKYSVGGTTYYSGVLRDASASRFRIFTTTQDLSTATTVDPTNAGFTSSDMTMGSLIATSMSGTTLDLTGAITGASLTLSGDMTVDTNTLKVNSTTNRVGIKTTTPSVELDVIGTAKFNDIQIGDTGETISRPVDNELAISTGGTERVRIDSTGKFGIGTDPTQALDVAGSIKQTGVTSKVIVTDSSGLLTGVTDGNSGQMLTTDGSGSFSFTTATGTYTDSMAIAAVEATSSLDLAGTATATGSLTLLHSGSNIYADIIGPLNRSLRFKLRDNGDVDAFKFLNLAGTELVVLQRTGHLGVGIADPAYHVDVGGDINYTGTLRKSGVAFGANNLADVNITSVANGNILVYNSATSKWINQANTDANTTYDFEVLTGTTKLRLAGSDGTNDDITISGGANVTVTRVSAGELSIASVDTNNIYTLTSGTTGSNATIDLTASGSGSGTQTLTVAGTGATTISETGSTITIASTNTTYDLTVPSGGTSLRLTDGSNNDDVAISGGGDTTVTRTSATELTVTTTKYTDAQAVSAVEGEGTLNLTGIVSVANDLKIDTDTLFVDVSTDRVGINQATPLHSLDVTGTGRITGEIKGQSAYGYTAQTYTLGDGNTGIANDWFKVCTWTCSSQYNNFSAQIRINGRGNATEVYYDLFVAAEFGVVDSTGWWTRKLDLFTPTGIADSDTFKLICNDGVSGGASPTAILYYKRGSDWDGRILTMISHYRDSNTSWIYQNTNVGETTPTDDGGTYDFTNDVVVKTLLNNIDPITFGGDLSVTGTNKLNIADSQIFDDGDNLKIRAKNGLQLMAESQYGAINIYTQMGTSGDSNDTLTASFGYNGDFKINGNGNADAASLFFVDWSADKIGIGTNAPTKDLHIYSDTTATILAQKVGGAQMEMVSTTNYGIIGTANDIPIQFKVNDLTKATLTSTGRLGIGIPAPAVPLHVGGNSALMGNVGIGTATPVVYSTNATTLQIADATLPELRLTNDATGHASSSGSLLQVSGSDLYIWNAENAKMRFATNATERMTIAADGKVGIGIPAPAVQLHVAGTADQRIRVQDTTDNYSVTMSGKSDGSFLFFGDQDSSESSFMTIGAFSGINNLDTENRDFHLYGTNTTTGFYFDESAGRFGIGTTSPASPLHIKSSTSDALLKIESTNSVSGATAPDLVLFTNPADGSEDGDFIGTIDFKGLTSTGAEQFYSRIMSTIVDNDNDSADGALYFKTINNNDVSVNTYDLRIRQNELRTKYLFFDGDGSNSNVQAISNHLVLKTRRYDDNIYLKTGSASSDSNSATTMMIIDGGTSTSNSSFIDFAIPRVKIAGAYGSGSQVMRMNSAGTGLEWGTISTATSTTINNNANNRIITGSDTANTLEGESFFTFNGNGTVDVANNGSTQLAALNITTTSGPSSTTQSQINIASQDYRGAGVFYKSSTGGSYTPWFAGRGYASTRFHIGAHATASDRMANSAIVIDTTGTVGIGVGASAPLAMLHVSSNNGTTDALRVDSNLTVTPTGAVTTSGSATVDNIGPNMSWSNVVQGQRITGTGIPSGAKIQSVDADGGTLGTTYGKIVMTVNATASATITDFTVNKSSTPFVVAEDGRVGIGTDTPVLGMSLTLNGDNSSYEGIAYQVDGSTKWKQSTDGSAMYVDSQVGGLEYSIRLRGADNSFPHYFHLDADNNDMRVGVGTNSPAHNIHVKNAGNAELKLERTSGTRLRLQSQASAGIIMNETNHKLQFGLNESIKATINTDGSFGLGTTSPLLRLAGLGMSINHASQSSFELQVGGASRGELWATSSEVVLGSYGSNLPLKFRVSNVDRVSINNSGMTVNQNLVVAGDLTVNGTTTTINTETLSVEDPLIFLAKNNTANSLDIGFAGKYVDTETYYTGIFRDASAGTKIRPEFNLFTTTEDLSTATVVDKTNSGFAYGSLNLDYIKMESPSDAGAPTPSDINSVNIGEKTGQLQIKTLHGEMKLGSTGASWNHIMGSQGKFYMNKPLVVDGTTGSSGFSISSYSEDFIFATGSGATKRMTISESTGYVGIGETTPAYNLEVTGSGSTYAQITTGNNTDYGGLLFGDSDANAVGRIQYRHADNRMTFYTNGSEKMRITSAGNVGIGTTIPAEKLEVAGDTSGNLAISIDNDNTAGLGTFTLKENTATVGIFQYRGSTNGTLPNTVRVGSNVANGNLALTYAGGSTGMYIKGSDGKVGIGTTIPATSLHIMDSGDEDTVLTVESNEVGGAIAPKINLYRNETGAMNSLTGEISFTGKNDANQVMDVARIISVIRDARDGLEAGSLDFYASQTGNNSWNFLRFSGSNQNIHFNPDGQNIHFRYDTSQTDNFFSINNGTQVASFLGKLGVGTNAPTAQLTVAGSGNGTEIGLSVNQLASDVGGVIRGNMIPSNSWVLGSGSVGIFSQNGITAENERVWGDSPHEYYNDRVILWQATNNDVGGGDGGWDTSYIPIDHTKNYRFSVWMKQSDMTGQAGGMSFYMGTKGLVSGSNTGLYGIADTSGSTRLTNPYFASSDDAPIADKWYLVVGYVVASDDTGTVVKGGWYDPVTGKKTKNIDTNFRWASDNTHCVHRTYAFYYDTIDTNPDMFFYKPRVEIIDGTQPSIPELLGNKVSYSTEAETVMEIINDSATANANATLRLSSWHGSDTWVDMTENTYGNFSITGGGSTRREILRMTDHDTTTGNFAIDPTGIGFATRIGSVGVGNTGFKFVVGNDIGIDANDATDNVFMSIGGSGGGHASGMVVGEDATNYTIFDMYNRGGTYGEKRARFYGKGDDTAYNYMAMAKGSVGIGTIQSGYTDASWDEENMNMYVKQTKTTGLALESTSGGSLRFMRHDTGLGVNEVLGKIEFYSNDGNDTNVNASISAYKDNGGVSYAPMAISLNTGTQGTIAERFRVESGGRAVMGAVPYASLVNTDRGSNHFMIASQTANTFPMNTLEYYVSGNSHYVHGGMKTGATGLQFGSFDSDTQVLFKTNDTISMKIETQASGNGKVLIGSTGSAANRLSILNDGSGAWSYAQWMNSTTGSAAGDGLIVGIDGSSDAVINHQESSKVLKVKIAGTTEMQIEAGAVRIENELIGVGARPRRIQLRQGTAQAFSTSEVKMNWSTSLYKDADYFTHSTSSSSDNITVVKSGWYEITVNLFYDNTAGNRKSIRSYIKKDNAQIAYTQNISYNRGETYGDKGNLFMTCQMDLDAGDVIEIGTIIDHQTETTAVSTVANGSFITIQGWPETSA